MRGDSFEVWISLREAGGTTMITTVQQHILQQQQELLKSTGREASGTFSWLLSGITLATKMIGLSLSSRTKNVPSGPSSRRRSPTLSVLKTCWLNGPP